jgi:hypothetical protein
MTTVRQPAGRALGQGLLLDHGSLDTGDLDLAALHAAWTHWRRHEVTTPDQVAARLAGAEGAVTKKVVRGLHLTGLGGQRSAGK